MMKFYRLILMGTAFGIAFINCSKLADNPASLETTKCEVCHLVPPADSMHRPGSNTDHCNQCHAGYTITGATIKLDSTHDNGKIDYRCNICHGFPVADSMWYHLGSSLTNINCDSCHSGVAVKNGIIEALPSTHENNSGIVAVKCNSCHAFPPGGRPHSNSSATRINCDSCHTGVVVTNGNISIQPGHETAPIKCIVCHAVPPSDGKHDTTNKFNCDSCHIGITIANKLYSLDSSTHDNGLVNLKCAVCHGYPPHNQFHDTTNKTNCANCHLGTTITNGTITQTALHDNGVIDMKACNICHGFPPTGNSHSHSSPTHVNCDSCHTRIQVSSPTAIPTLIQDHNLGPIKCIVCHAAPPNDGTHDTTQKFNCDSCHTGITIKNNVYTLDSTLHNNGTINFSRCDLCHDFPPTVKPHPVHVTGKGYACTVCHVGFNGSTVPPTPAPYHRGDTVVKFSDFDSLKSRGGAYDVSTKNCSAVYCHGNFLDGTKRTVNVNDSNTIGCGSCHDTTSMFTLGHPRTDTTTWHRHTNAYVLQNCGNCHYGYSILPPVKTVDSLHVNGRYDVVVTNKQNVVTPLTQPNGAGKHCSTACH
jgi:predicted CxxxxCH...CXXCH cytochrome family protein